MAMAHKLPPRRATKLLGRQVELARSVEAVVAMQAVSLHGLGGMGKTELALHILHDETVIARFASRRYFIECETITTAQELRLRIESAVGAGSIGGLRYPVQSLAAYLGEQPATLIVLDNLETTLDPAAERDGVRSLVKALLNVDTVALVSTCRSAAAPVPHRRWAADDGADEAIGGLQVGPACALFRAICRVPEKDQPALERLIQLVGGHALSLELLAARTAAVGADVEETLEQFVRIGASYVAADADAKSKDFSLAVSLRMSLESLRVTETVEPQQLLRILALLESGIAKADLDKLGLPERNWADGAERLLSVGLVHFAAGRKCVPHTWRCAEVWQIAAAARRSPLGARAPRNGHGHRVRRDHARLGRPARGVGVEDGVGS